MHRQLTEPSLFESRDFNYHSTAGHWDLPVHSTAIDVMAPASDVFPMEGRPTLHCPIRCRYANSELFYSYSYRLVGDNCS